MGEAARQAFRFPIPVPTPVRFLDRARFKRKELASPDPAIVPQPLLQRAVGTHFKGGRGGGVFVTRLTSLRNPLPPWPLLPPPPGPARPPKCVGEADAFLGRKVEVAERGLRGSRAQVWGGHNRCAERENSARRRNEKRVSSVRGHGKHPQLTPAVQQESGTAGMGGAPLFRRKREETCAFFHCTRREGVEEGCLASRSPHDRSTPGRAGRPHSCPLFPWRLLSCEQAHASPHALLQFFFPCKYASTPRLISP